MLVGLHDAEFDHIKGKSFPNYALMKISAWHKRRGDAVEMFTPIDPNAAEQLTLFPLEEYPPKRKANIYDVVYSSKVFDFTPENPYLPADTIKGGTGYDIKSRLPPEIDGMFPDYSIYPDCDYAIGYITRGCPNKCPWCVVSQKEGGIKPYRHWQQLVRQDSNKLVLMDNNILSCEYGIAELESLIGSGYAIDLNQGMDARLVNDRIASILARLKWIKYIRFSCDQKAQINAILKTAELLEKHGVKPYRLFIYVLVTKDIDDAAYRVERLRELHNISLYVQAERNEAKGIIPNRAQLEFAQRYVYGRCYKKETWSEYCKRYGTDFKEVDK
ncbi:MAG: hypothetical protein OSJ43_05430 [Oscillospiraceae bacterium]|nr:hypothetical protein [Oscillospiraceae bacterium]